MRSLRQLAAPLAPAIRPGCLEKDAPFVGDLAARTLGQFGDYGQLLPQWMARWDVETHIAQRRGEPVGFALVGYCHASPPGPYADLLAIAVAPSAQRDGVGQLLLRHVISHTAEMFPELRLSVAHGNTRARALFEREGFGYVLEELGTYSQGQLAMRMARPLQRGH